MKLVGIWYYMEISTRGGKRPNSGRKKGEATVTLSYRVKAATSKELDVKIREVILKHKTEL